MKVFIMEFDDSDSELLKNCCINSQIHDLREGGYTIKKINFGFANNGHINSVAIVYENTKIEKWEV